MLFLHKNADKWAHIAVYTGARPKGHEADYERVTAETKDTVWERVSYLAEQFDIPQPDLPGMKIIFDDWVKASSFDLEQENIYKMMAPAGMATRKKEGIKAEWRYYNNYTDLVLALYGEVCSLDNLKVENNVAAYLLNSPKINALLVSVATKITIYAEKIFSEGRDKLVQGNYRTLHLGVDSWQKWTSQFESMESKELVPVLYDITMSFKKPLNWTEPLMDQDKITKDNMRMNVSTPEEDFYWASRARWANVPIWAAPSYTAQLMLLVAQNAGADTDEIRAFAYGIFAYWNQCYPHTATPIHRMYGVMTAAQEFGVPDYACNPRHMYLHAVSFTLL
ncbi:MAG: hypothetical protein ACNI3A_19320 [Desulfovibrio sp.]|uniref:hypothetical protein n=1 Tax=Desulfovibrio sp. 7SRBS1 TaxID=3378064 RepID=UPI003B3FA871